ncbi:ALPL-like protein [Mya arenaria]|uniref:ALPL-like protein n=2 Tax=Mya arenaria TaxID=6604 RepID=A0ABY7FTG5_MYAAR|nr:ALPL-like protein [Mya arenaria]
MPATEVGDHQNGDDAETSFIQESHKSNLDVSLNFHDYTCEPVPAPSAIRMIETQTCIPTMTIGTQTESVQTFRSISTQTDTCEQRGIGVQAMLPTLVYEDVMDNPSKLNFYTGIPNKGLFNALFDEMGDMQEKPQTRCRKSSGGRPRALRLIDEFFMVLMRLRLGLLVADLAARFCISQAACSRLLNKWIDYLDMKLDFLIMWPSKSAVKFNMPKLFRDKFPDTRVIIDCTEIKTETPSSLQLKSLMYSDYKSHITWKSLVGISPSGHVTFVSDLWVGSISDKKITNNSGIIDLCEEGDSIMADKGFIISDLTTPKGIKLVIPPFKRGHSKFSKREVQQTRDIANARIHVERQMERIKNFRIVQGVMPITMSSRASKVWKLCAKLTNLQPPLVPH